jgi:hypothetical protein
MSKFTDRLWHDLVREHGPELAQMDPRAADRWWARRRLLAGTGVGVAGLATAAALIIGAASSSPAFAVTPNHDGTVTVKILRLGGIAGANARLAAMHVRAKVVRVAGRCGAGIEKPPTGAVTNIVRHSGVWRGGPARSVRVDPRQIPLRNTVVIAAWKHGKSVELWNERAGNGARPACPPPPPPGCPTGRGIKRAHDGNSGNSESSGSGGKSGNSGTVTSSARSNSIRAARCRRAAPAPGNSDNSGSSGKS